MSEEEQVPEPPEQESTALPAEEQSKQPDVVEDDGLLQERLEEALREKDQFRAMAQRAQADLINYRRRSQNEMDEVKLRASSELLIKILSVVDDLERAISLVPQDAVAPGWLDGLDLVLRNVHNILDSEGVSKIEALRQPFEPWEFEAVHYEETSETKAGMVTNVLRDGYKLHDKVLRAAQVVVAREPEPQAQPEEETSETEEHSQQSEEEAE